jgi:hypothetical protein
MTNPMIESEWLACGEPQPMLRHLGCKAGERKRRLFACACCRRAWHLLADPRVRTAVETAERYADKAATETELENASDCAEVVYRSHKTTAAGHAAVHAVVSTTAGSLDASHMARLAAEGIGNPNNVAEPSRCERAGLETERAAQTAVLRDIIGNPFRPAAIEPSWLHWHGGAVLKLAQAIYASRAYGRMAALGDALERAGCTDPDILEHCRSLGQHVRGCWVVDLVLGKG